MFTTLGVGVGVGVGDGEGVGDGVDVGVDVGVGATVAGFVPPLPLLPENSPFQTKSPTNKSAAASPQRISAILRCLRLRFFLRKYCSLVIFVANGYSSVTLFRFFKARSPEIPSVRPFVGPYASPGLQGLPSSRR